MRVVKKERKLVKIVHYYDDGTSAVLEGKKNIQAYLNNINLAAMLVLSHCKEKIMKEKWKEKK